MVQVGAVVWYRMVPRKLKFKSTVQQGGDGDVSGGGGDSGAGDDFLGAGE